MAVPAEICVSGRKHNISIMKPSLGFWMEYLHFTLTYSKGNIDDVRISHKRWQSGNPCNKYSFENHTFSIKCCCLQSLTSDKISSGCQRQICLESHDSRREVALVCLIALPSVCKVLHIRPGSSNCWWKRTIEPDKKTINSLP